MARKRSLSGRAGSEAPRRRTGGTERDPGSTRRTEPASESAAGPRPPQRARRNRERLLAEYRAWSESMPAVRPEKVVEAKLRISRGDYGGDEVLLATLRAMLCEILPPRSSRPVARRAKRAARPLAGEPPTPP